MISRLPDLILKKKSPYFSKVMALFENFGILNLSARYLRIILARDLKVGQLMVDDE